MNILAFGLRVRGKNPYVRICVAAFALFCSNIHAQAATYTVGGSISNLTGSGLVLRLDAQAGCIASGNISSVTNSPAAGGSEQCLITATSYCCSESSSNAHVTTNPDGTFDCTVICGAVINSVPIPGFGSSVPQAGPPLTQTVSPAANATSYTFGTPVSDASPYTVSIDTQPSNPAQVCTLVNATGTVSGANVTNANVSCTTVTHTVTATAGANGTASPPSQSINDGSTATVTLTPSAGFKASASGCGGSLGSDGLTYTTAAITADCTVVATFSPVTHTVTVTVGPNGTASPPSQSVNDGSTAIVTLTPNAGFEASASGCRGSLGSDGVTYTTAAITADCTVAATFTQIPKSPTTTALSLSPNPALTNQSVAASVTVSSNALPTGTSANASRSKIATAIAAVMPTGTVAISGGGQSCNAALVNGSGSCILAYATPGTYSITATYPGDTQNLPSTATTSLAVAAPAPVIPSPMLDGIALVVLGLAVLALTSRRRSAGWR